MFLKNIWGNIPNSLSAMSAPTRRHHGNGFSTRLTIVGLVSICLIALGALVACPTEDDNESSDASLNALTLSAGTLSPTFTSDTLAYDASVVSTVESVTVTATPTDTGAATVSITPPDADAATNGHQVSLEVGDTVITIVVTAEDDSTTRTYTITVNRAAVGASSDASLSALTLSDGTLSPTFASAELTYTATVSNSVESVTVTATPTVGASTVSIMPADTDTDTNGHQVSLRVGDTPIMIGVTAADNSTMEDYTITVTRTQAGAQPSAVLTKTDGTEADTNPTDAVFILTLTNAPSDTATVTYTISGTVGDEYSPISLIEGPGVINEDGGVSNIAIGSGNNMFGILNPATNNVVGFALRPVSDDDGRDEIITLTIVSITFADDGTATDIAGSAITGTGVTNGALSLTIVDDDVPSAALTKTDGTEADTNPTNAVFTLTLTNAPSDTATVTYTLSGAIGDEYTTDSAIGGAGVSGTLSATANSTFDITNPDTNTEATITLAPMSDADGSDETITLTIVSITFADSGTATDIAGSAITGTDVTNGALSLTIVDDDDSAITLDGANAIGTISTHDETTATTRPEVIFESTQGIQNIGTVEDGSTEAMASGATVTYAMSADNSDAGFLDGANARTSLAVTDSGVASSGGTFTIDSATGFLTFDVTEAQAKANDGDLATPPIFTLWIRSFIDADGTGSVSLPVAQIPRQYSLTVNNIDDEITPTGMLTLRENDFHFTEVGDLTDARVLAFENASQITGGSVQSNTLSTGINFDPGQGNRVVFDGDGIIFDPTVGDGQFASITYRTYRGVLGFAQAADQTLHISVKTGAVGADDDGMTGNDLTD